MQDDRDVPIKSEDNEIPQSAEEQEVTPAQPVAPEELLAVVEDRYLRLAAEFDNFRKRVAREQARLYEAVVDDVLAEALPTLDNLDRACAHQSETDEGKAILDGVRMIRDALWAMFSRKGVVEIDAAGKPFDPMTMEAVARVPHESPEGTVVDVTLAGYARGDRVLRHAQVVVSAGKYTSTKESG